ncbi:hypothetical protein BDR07DRAFT_1422613 [Suillus spraguei]|nr:hypothetical protein BDR07DRAFT_1422613 [Suillus spraguei]
MRLTLGVPVSVLSSTFPAPQPPPPPKETPLCDFPSCTEKRKYRAVRDWTIGACCPLHLRVVGLDIEEMVSKINWYVPPEFEAELLAGR